MFINSKPFEKNDDAAIKEAVLKTPPGIALAIPPNVKEEARKAAELLQQTPDETKTNWVGKTPPKDPGRQR